MNCDLQPGDLSPSVVLEDIQVDEITRKSVAHQRTKPTDHSYRDSSVYHFFST